MYTYIWRHENILANTENIKIKQKERRKQENFIELLYVLLILHIIARVYSNPWEVILSRSPFEAFQFVKNQNFFDRRSIPSQGSHYTMKLKVTKFDHVLVK